jgi:hypothetical protein
MAVAALVALLVPAPALAHAGGEPIIHVAAERVIQGETFTVVAADLGPDALVTLEISSRGRSYAVGQVVAQSDGHFTETFVMPADAPDGYAELWARGDDGSQAMMWLLVGDGADTPAPGAPDTPAAGWSLPLVALGAAWVVGLGAIGYVLLRSRRPVARARRRR